MNECTHTRVNECMHTRENKCVHATRASREDCRGSWHLRPWRPVGVGSSLAPPEPQAPLQLALLSWGEACAGPPGCPGGSRKDGLSTWLGSLLPRGCPAWHPSGCARQIPSSWDLPGTSLSEDGAPGRGVCVRTERVHPGAACSALVPSWGLGEGQVTHQPPKPSPAAPVLQDPVQGKAVPRQVGVGHPGAPCAWRRPSPSPRPAGGPCGLAGLSSAFGGLGWFWPWFLVAVRPWTSSSPPRGFGSLSAQWGSEG